MKIKAINGEFSILKVRDCSETDSEKEFIFTARTDEEISVVCPTADAPKNHTTREDGWRAFRIDENLDFSLIGIIAKISAILAENGIGIFAISTYNTDYIFTRTDNFLKALRILAENGYDIEGLE